MVLRASLLVVFALLARADSLENAQRARAMLGADVWSRVIRIENIAVASKYPPMLFAVVFELSGLLWFYTDADGTQSFSLHRHNLAAEKADFAPLLQDIDPGFVRWDVVPADSAVAPPAGAGGLPNGCLIESFAYVRKLRAAGVDVRNAQLVSFYFDAEGTLAGHTVLAYEGRKGAFLIDPNNPTQPVRVGKRLPSEPLELARSLGKAGESIVQARALILPPTHAGSLASIASRQPGDYRQPLLN
ncbi:MAG: hypothetical protein ABIV50_08470 [Opitutus sp.]